MSHRINPAAPSFTPGRELHHVQPKRHDSSLTRTGPDSSWARRIAANPITVNNVKRRPDEQVGRDINIFSDGNPRFPFGMYGSSNQASLASPEHRRPEKQVERDMEIFRNSKKPIFPFLKFAENQPNQLYSASPPSSRSTSSARELTPSQPKTPRLKPAIRGPEHSLDRR